MVEAAKSLLLILSALLPIVDPLGGSPIFLALTRDYSPSARRALSWRIAMDSFFLLVGSYFIGTHILAFFGISLPVVQVGGGCSLLSMIPVLFMHNVTWAAICLSLGFFWSEFTIGPMWAIPMDIAPRFAGSASGLMNTGSALAAIVSPLVFGYIIDRTNNWELPFLGSIGLLLLGSIVAFWMKPGEKLSTAQLRERPAVSVVA